jgi:hypothetical protein
MKGSRSDTKPRRTHAALGRHARRGASLSALAMLACLLGTASAATAAPAITNAFVLSGQVRGVFTINTAEDCVASNLGVSTGTGARVIGFDLSDPSFRPASDKWGMQIYVAKAGTTHFGKGTSTPKVELLAATPKDKPDYMWLDGPGTVTISAGFKKGSLDVTLPPYELVGLYPSKATKKETVVGNWDCG